METKKKFSMTLAQPELLRDSIKVLSGLLDEARLCISKDGLRITEMDAANVGMGIFHLLPSACVEYETQEQPFSIGLNIVELSNILKNAKKNDMLVLSLDIDEPLSMEETAIILDKGNTFISGNLGISLKGSMTRNYTLPLFDLSDRTEAKIPNLEFKAKVQLDSKAFNDVIKESGTIAKSIVFEAKETNKSFTMSADNGISKADIPFREDENTKIQGEAKARYSIKYLKKMSAAKCLSDDVMLEFGTDYPLRMTYRQIDKLSLSWILAPRVDND